MKYYVKKYPEIMRNVVNEHRLELLHYIETQETTEKILVAYIKSKIV